jgi:hypothetical protein
MENKQMVKVALVMSGFILASFAFALGYAYEYTSVITDNTEDTVRSALWNFIGGQFIVVSIVLGLVFAIRSRKR